MPCFTIKDLKEKNFCKKAWNRLLSGEVQKSTDGLLFPEDAPQWKCIMCSERLRKQDLLYGNDLATLMVFQDFRTCMGTRRPDPTPDQWIWLYMNIGERHRRLTLDQVAQIMGAREAFFPFFCSIPDKKYADAIAELDTSKNYDESDQPLQYPRLEEAIEEDAPAKLSIYRMMSCSTVSLGQLMNRALYLKKTKIIASLMQEYPVARQVKYLLDFHTTWNDPTSIFKEVLPSHAKEIAQWRDLWGNGFFWYLYRRPILKKNIIENLPAEIFETFTVKNQYGISPEMIWTYYRPRPNQVNEIE